MPLTPEQIPTRRSELKALESNLVVLLTGAGSGIGLSMAKLLYKKKYKVVITARHASAERLKTEVFQESDRFLIRPFDLCDETSQKRLLEDIESRWGGVDILINNAGVAYRSVFEHMDRIEEDHQFQINYFGPMQLVRKVLPHMRNQRFGKIINVSSTAGMMAMPTMSSYSASKFALEGASEGLWYEMRPWGVTVTLVEPGFVASSSFKKAPYSSLGKSSLDDEKSTYHFYYTRMFSFIEKLMNRSPTTTKNVARHIRNVMISIDPPLRLFVTPDALFFTILRRLLPRRLYHRLLYKSLPDVENWVPTLKPEEKD